MSHYAAAGRQGGLKGGPARAKKLSRAQRRAIGKKAVETRWKKQRERIAASRRLTAVQRQIREAIRAMKEAERRRADGYP